MGGAVATSFTAHHRGRVKKLILIDPSYPKWDGSGIAGISGLGKLLIRMAYLPGIAESQTGDFFRPEKFPDWTARFQLQMECKGFQKAILKSLALHLYHIYSALPFKFADQKGYFRDAGIQLEYQFYSKGNQVLDAVRNEVFAGSEVTM